MQENQLNLFSKKKKDKTGSNPRKIFLVDANSLVHRAYHALPTTLTTSEGRVVNAAYGFASMLIKLIKEFSPDIIIAAFDSKEPTFRHKKYVEYKANRPETDEELVQQFPLVKEIIESFDIPIVEKEGYEADDIIAAFSGLVEKDSVFIVSGDRDLLQLVNPNVRVLSTRRGISDIKQYDREGVFKRLNVYPEEIPDYLALKGEPGDNIPGIPGIGEKTASKLVRKYGSLESVYKNLEDFKGKKIYKKLYELKEQAFLAKKLATLVYDVPIDKNLISKKLVPDTKKITETFSKLEFSSLLSRLGVESKDLHIPELSAETLCKKISLEKLKNAVKQKNLMIFIYSNSQKKIFLGDGKFYSEVSAGDRKDVIDFLNSSERTYTNNLKVLVKNLPDIELSEWSYLINNRKIVDLSIALWLLNPEQKDYRLKSLMDDNKLPYRYISDVTNWGSDLLEKIESENMTNVFFNVESKIPPILAKMENLGLPIDLESLYNLSKELEQKIDNEEEKVLRLTGYDFNLNSPQQLSYVLFDKLKLEKGRKKKKHYSTNQATLLKLVNKHPAIMHILNYRELAKLKNSFVDVFLEKTEEKTNRLKGKFIQTGTATGRLASEDPNLQNIPLKGEFAVRLRETIKAPQDKLFISADYSQIDLRVMAHFSKEPRLIEAFRKNKDVHSSTASEVFAIEEGKVTSELRRIAKAINFGIIYGISAGGLAAQAGISVSDSRKYIDKYFERYKKVKDYMDNAVKDAYVKGFVTTLLGRRRYLKGLKSSNPRKRKAAERLVLNTPIQGTSADIIKLAMIEFSNLLQEKDFGAQIILQVHDSLVIECRKDQVREVINAIKSTMENVVELDVPLDLEIKSGRTFAELV